MTGIEAQIRTELDRLLLEYDAADQLAGEARREADREPSGATLKESAPDLTRPGDMRSDLAYPSDAEVRAALREWYQGMFGGGWTDKEEERMRAALLAAQEVRRG